MNKLEYVIEIQLFPPIYYFYLLVLNIDIKIEKYEYFQKMSFRNRFTIASANGLIDLTIPLKGGRDQKKIITDILINHDENWQKRHWKTITSAYKKAPFFDLYCEEIKELIFRREETLFDFNIHILYKILNWLNINSLIDFTLAYSSLIKGLDYRNKLNPKSYQNGEAFPMRHYSQVFEERIGFQPNLSILDLLFCEGPNAINIIQNRVL